MPNLKHLSGKEVINIFEKLGFQTVSQRGSHVKLRRISRSGKKETLTIPFHKELDTGTLRAIIRQASQYVSTDMLRDYFYV